MLPTPILISLNSPRGGSDGVLWEMIFWVLKLSDTNLEYVISLFQLDFIVFM